MPHISSPICSIKAIVSQGLFLPFNDTTYTAIAIAADTAIVTVPASATDIATASATSAIITADTTQACNKIIENFISQAVHTADPSSNSSPNLVEIPLNGSSESEKEIHGKKNSNENGNDNDNENENENENGNGNEIEIENENTKNNKKTNKMKIEIEGRKGNYHEKRMKRVILGFNCFPNDQGSELVECCTRAPEHSGEH